MAKFGRFDHRNKKKERNKKNSINRVKRIKEADEEWYDKSKFRQALGKIFPKSEGSQEH